MAEHETPRTRARMVRLLTAGAVGLLLTACSGGDDAAAPTPAGASSGGTVQSAEWPQYWITEEGAEKGLVTDAVESYWAGYDGDTVVYNGTDVVRGLDRASGDQLWKRLLPDGAAICAVPDETQVQDHTAVFGVAPGGLGSIDTRCTETIGVDTLTGKILWSHELTSQADSVSEDLDLQGDRALVRFFPGISTENQTLAVLDLTSGDVLWSSDNTGTWIPKDLRDYRVTQCDVRAGIAASDPVVILVQECYGGSEPVAVGVDLDTGKRLWVEPFWGDLEDLPEDLAPHPSDARYWGGATNYDHESVSPVWFDDPMTGSYTMQSEPDVMPSDDPLTGGLRRYFTGAATPVGDISPYLAGVTTKNLYLSGETAVYTKGLQAKNVTGLVVVAVDAPTGDELWRHELHGTLDGGAGLGGPLGFTPDGGEFWVSEDDTTITRLDARTGEVIGTGEPAPALNLVDFVTVADDFLLQRGTPGIYDEASGLAYYQWRSPQN